MALSQAQLLKRKAQKDKGGAEKARKVFVKDITSWM
jgi:hypothetical protein